MQLAKGTVKDYELIYNEWDIEYLWEVYAVQKASEYSNPKVKRIKDG